MLAGRSARQVRNADAPPPAQGRQNNRSSASGVRRRPIQGSMVILSINVPTLPEKRRTWSDLAAGEITNCVLMARGRLLCT